MSALQEAIARQQAAIKAAQDARIAQLTTSGKKGGAKSAKATTPTVSTANAAADDISASGRKRGRASTSML
jgi:hypothetical protein